MQGEEIMGPKSIGCLTLCALPILSEARKTLEARLNAKFSEKAIYRRLEILDRRGYIDYGVSARTGWLTDKGKVALNNEVLKARETAKAPKNSDRAIPRT